MQYKLGTSTSLFFIFFNIHIIWPPKYLDWWKMFYISSNSKWGQTFLFLVEFSLLFKLTHIFEKLSF